ncbi:YcjF family protein [Halomonas citrativorans]|uniref:TIGR01620 family protein n=1 Tax=Halomonas citrativorans TaxID=2742612 RepID=A0ABR9FGD9_9GAMM|nr:TIGR01620 family protein [Halomonas citrativorans]MBE0404225.1 TIGR01620 family protein [Halomonas citrativorans]
MTDPQPRRNFRLHDTPDTATEQETRLRQQQRFEATDDDQPLITAAEEQALPATSLGAPRKRRWGLMFALAGGATLGIIELATGIPDALSQSAWMNLAWQLFGISLIGLGGMSLIRELGRLRRLKRHDRLRSDLAELPQRSPHQAKKMAEALRQQLKLSADDPHWQAFERACEPHHNGEEVQALLRHHLLAPRDREAQRLITRMSGETAIMVAISPLTLVDMALVAWRSLAMVDRLCRLYGLELGYASRLRLFRNVLRNMAFAGVSELAADASMDMLSLHLAGRISTRASQGLATGLLSARLGLRAQRLCRPVAFIPEEQPRMADLRQDLWRQIKRLDKEPAPATRTRE